MSDPDPLFPAPEVAELLAVIDGSVSEVRQFAPEVRDSLARVRHLLGDYRRLAAAAAVWDEEPVAGIGAAQVLLDVAQPDTLADDWAGDAFAAYRSHHAAVVAALADIRESAGEVVAVIRATRDMMAAQYRAAVESFAGLSCGMLGLAGGSGGRVGASGAGPAIRLLGDFVVEVESYLDAAGDTTAAQAELLCRIRAAVAAVRVPPAGGASALGQPDRWQRA